jgi:NAD(P)-dependent dehydrogenase (short-subunit alcohol dehydrogenase family)
MARDPFSLEGKVAFVTGANSGLGMAVALSLCDAGAQVAIGARRAARNAEALASLAPGAAAFTVDVTDEGSAERALAGTVEPFGHLDILVNNAGVSQRASVMDLDRATWQQVIDTNLTGAFLCGKVTARDQRALPERGVEVHLAEPPL